MSALDHSPVWLVLTVLVNLTCSMLHRFLSAIADRPLIEAALAVRDEEGRTADIRSLFHRVGDEYGDEMSFDAEMIVPEEGVDDLGQKAQASITFLRYSITLVYRLDDGLRSLGYLEIIKEEVTVHRINEDTRKNQYKDMLN